MRKKLCFILFAFIAIDARSQTDTSFYDLAFLNVKNTAHDPEDAGIPLYNGIEHLGYPSYPGSAYYGSNDWQKGSVQYKNVVYTDVYLKYDLVKNELIVRYLDKVRGVSLFTPWIQNFSLANSEFIYFPDHSILPSGIYQLGRKGVISWYVKRSKVLVETIINVTVESKFVEKDVFYAVKNNAAYLINNKKTLLHLVEDKKAQMKTYMKTIGSKYKDDRAAFIKKTIDYYNQLSY
jgi:hypothetical protein